MRMRIVVHMNTIADRIDFAMRHAGIKSQADLARLSGVPNSTIVRILKDNSDPNVANLAAISRACGISMDWLATGREQEPASPTVTLTYVTHDELQLLTAYREATSDTQQRILAAITALSTSTRSTTSD